MEGRALNPFLAIKGLNGRDAIFSILCYWRPATGGRPSTLFFGCRETPWGEAVSIGLPSGGCCRGAPGGGGGLGLVMIGVWPRQGRLIPFHVHPHIFMYVHVFMLYTPD